MARALGKRRRSPTRDDGRPGPAFTPYQDRGRDADPLAGTELVLIDGTNLLHALGRGTRGSGGTRSEAEGGRQAGGSRSGAPDQGGPPVPPSAVVGRIRGVIPAGVRVELLFDGRTSGVTGRLATGMSVRYSGRASADSVIVEAVEGQAMEGGPASTWSVLVVTDDRELRGRVAALGARSAGTTWLLRRLGTGRDLAPARGGPADGPRGGDRGSGARGDGWRPSTGRRGSPGVPRPKAGTTFGHGRPPRAFPERD
ncbi:MAG TPA: hypothetical protein VEX41_03185 [Candidatus Eisenbacteria bacterium]|nr:hypothetical protein [Candidatus Eisenbacteria bacterium]